MRKEIYTLEWVKDHQMLDTGHKTQYWCCQDENQMQKHQPSQKEGVIHRDTIEMHHYDCKSKLNIAYQTTKWRRDLHNYHIA